MIHYVYVGHFVPEGRFIRFARSGADTAFRPVLTRPLDLKVFDELLRDRGLDVDSIPDEWGLLFDEGFLVWDRFAGRDASELIAGLAERSGCDLADYTTQSLLRPEDLRF